MNTTRVLEVPTFAKEDPRRTSLLEYFKDYTWKDGRTSEQHHTWELELEYANINC